MGQMGWTDGVGRVRGLHCETSAVLKKIREPVRRNCLL